MDRDTLTEATNSIAEKATPTTQWSESAQQRAGAAQSSAFADAESAAAAAQDQVQRASDAPRETAMGAGERMSGAASSAPQQASDTGARLGRAARSTFASATDKAASSHDLLRSNVAEAAGSVGESAKGLRRSAASTGRNLAGLATEQPLVLAGLGLAIGACLGAMFPSTQTEDQLLGGASDATKSRPSGQYEKAKGVASATVEAATDAAQQQGLMASVRRETGAGSAATLGRSEPEGKTRATGAAHAEPAHGG